MNRPTLIGMKVPGVIYTWAEVSDPWLGATFGMPAEGDAGHRQNQMLEWPAYKAAFERAQSHPPGAGELILHWVRYVAFSAVHCGSDGYPPQNPPRAPPIARRRSDR
jgi:hypothetical protein